VAQVVLRQLVGQASDGPDSHLGGSVVPKIGVMPGRSGGQNTSTVCACRAGLPKLSRHAHGSPSFAANADSKRPCSMFSWQRDAKAAEADWSAAAKERTSRRDPDVAARRNYRRSDEVEDLGCML